MMSDDGENDGDDGTPKEFYTIVVTMSTPIMIMVLMEGWGRMILILTIVAMNFN